MPDYICGPFDKDDPSAYLTQIVMDIPAFLEALRQRYGATLTLGDAGERGIEFDIEFGPDSTRCVEANINSEGNIIGIERGSAKDVAEFALSVRQIVPVDIELAVFDSDLVKLIDLRETTSAKDIEDAFEY